MEDEKKRTTEGNPKEGLLYFYGRTRYVILILSNIALTIGYCNSLALNFTVICMDDVVENSNGSVLPGEEQHWLLSPSKTNALFSAVAIGCLLGAIALTPLTHRCGMRGVMSIYGGLSALATLLFPAAVAIEYPAVFVARVLQGVPTSLSYPATGLISSQWATSKGTGAFIAILSTHVQFCSIFTMPVAGELCESQWGWRSVYYVHGIISVIVFFTFFIFFRDDPHRHESVSPQEKARIVRGKEDQTKSSDVPYRRIMADPCVWAIWLSTIGGTLGFQVFLLYGPTYMNRVLGLDIAATGFATALPYILSAAVKFTLGPISDKAACVSPRTRMICFAAFSQGCMAICFLIMSLTTSHLLAQILYTLAIVFSGINAVGVVKCSSVVCRQHVHFVMSVASLILCLTVLLVPVAVAAVCTENTAEEWASLFRWVALIVVLANTPFVFLARDKPAPWTSQLTPNTTKKNIDANWENKMVY